MKKNYYFLLMAALVCGISLCVTSCKDDDGEDNGNGDGQETYEGLSSLEDDQLADLIVAWTDTNHDELNGSGWRNRTFEPTVGLALDASRPGVRTIAVGTIEEADRYAVSFLSTLGIDYESPSGFSYTNDQVGTLKYSHGGSDGNTLGTISVDVRQMPVLEEIRLVKTLPENADGTPYYKCGDVIRYKGRCYVCVSKHKYGQEARFLTVNDQDTHSRGKFTYMGVGVDSVYNDEMAKAEVLGDWLQNVVCDYQMWLNVRGRMADTGNEQYIRQVVPEDNAIRVSFIETLSIDESYIPDLQKSQPLERSLRYQALSFAWKEEVRDDGYIYSTIAPVGFLLADKLRYTQIKDKWVPYIFLARQETFFKVYYYEHELPSQASDPSHFKFKALNEFDINTKDSLIGKPSFNDKPSKIKGGIHRVCVIGMHWTHDPWINEAFNDKFKTVYHFCADYLYHPRQKDREFFNQYPTEWTFRNITSRSLTFTDKGKRNSSYENVVIQD